MRVFIATATLMSALSGVAWADPSATAFDLLEDGSVVVPVTIGGTGPYRFVIDTGSSRTVISSRVSQGLRLPVIAATTMVTPSGRQDAYVVRVTGLAIGAGAGVDVAAAMVAQDRYAAGQRVDGLIGQDVLAAVVYTIDYQQRTITWHSGAEHLPAGERLPLQVRDNRLLVILPQRDDDPQPLSLIPDSGSDALVLFTHATDKVRFTPVEVGLLSGLTGTKLALRVQLERLVVGRARLDSPFAVIVEGTEPPELMGDGLLPLHVFARVTLNVSEGYLIIQ